MTENSDSKPEVEIDYAAIEAINEKAIKNQFFTPDKVYIDLGLFKDIPIGVIYADKLISKCTEEEFNRVKNFVLLKVKEYQVRLYDTSDTYFSNLGYPDKKIEELLTHPRPGFHDTVFMVAPVTKFLSMLTRHTARNQNNSSPAEKYTKIPLGGDQYTLEPIPVTYYINTYPLTLSPKLLTDLAVELGEALGVNISFLNKNPTLFDKSDWDAWMKDIDCFYLDSLGKFTRGDFALERQGNLDFMGIYFFARKRFEKEVIPDMIGADFEQQIQMLTAQIDMMCDFAWLQNNDVRLTEEKIDVPLDESDPVPEDGIPS